MGIAKIGTHPPTILIPSVPTFLGAGFRLVYGLQIWLCVRCSHNCKRQTPRPVHSGWHTPVGTGQVNDLASSQSVFIVCSPNPFAANCAVGGVSLRPHSAISPAHAFWKWHWQSESSLSVVWLVACGCVKFGSFLWRGPFE